MKISFVLCLLFGAVLWILSSRFTEGRQTLANSSELAVHTKYSSKYKDPSCQGIASCKGKCTERIQYGFIGEPEPLCHCDPLCAKFKDCCGDYVRMCKLSQAEGTGVASNVTINPSTDSARPEAQLEFQCVTFEISKNRPGVWMVASCSRDWPKDENYERCTGAPGHVFSDRSIGVLDDLPAADFNTGITYRNRYCAACNHVNKQNTFHWKLLSRCHIKPPASLTGLALSDFVLKHCENVYSLPLFFQKRRHCYPVIINCSMSNDIAQLHACTQGKVGLVFVRGQAKKHFQNYHCLVCNGFTGHDAVCGPARFPITISKPRSFKILMTFLPAKDKTVTISRVLIKCRNEGKLYDIYLETCRDAVLPEPGQAVFDKYRMKLWMSPNSSTTNFFGFDDKLFLEAFMNLFALKVKQVRLINTKKEEMSMVALLDLSANGYRDALNETAGSKTTLSIRALLNFNSTFKLRIGSRVWRVFKVTKRRLACTKPRTYQPQDYSLKKLATNEMSVVINKTQQNFTQQEFYIAQADQPGGMIRGTLVVCGSVFTMACAGALIPLNEREFTMLPNKTMLRNLSGEMFAQGDYDIDNTSVWVCTKLPSPVARGASVTPKEDPVMWYMTVVGLVLSLMSLILVLVTHCVFKELRSLPGKNLMNFCISLFMAHLLWLLTSGATANPSTCRTAAIFLHYFFLVTFFCTMVIAHDTKRTFSRKTTRVRGLARGSSSKARFACYCGFTWAVPAALVGICVILDQNQVVAMGYGNELACWITNKSALLIFFVTPIGSIMLYNTMSFLQSVWAIRSTRRSSRQANSHVHHQPREIYIYLRLLTLMGFAWVFGFGATLIHDLLAYPFVILSSSHGVYLAAAFIFKPRILLMYKGVLMKRLTRSSLQTTRTTTTSAPDHRSSNLARRTVDCEITTSRI